MSSQGIEDVWQGHGHSGRQTGQSHIRMQINQEEKLGSKTDRAAQGSSVGKESLKTFDCKNLWRVQRQETLSVSQESSLERPTRS